MSIADFASQTLFGVQNINADNIRCEQIDANVVGIQNLTCNTIAAVSADLGSLKLTQSPALDVSNSNALVYDSITGDIKYNNTAGVGSVTNGQNLGTVPVFQAKLGSILQFNGLSANPAQGFVLTPAPPLTGGDIVINNIFLDQDLKTTAAPSFLGPLHLGGMTQDGTITLSTTSLATSTIKCGSNPSQPMQVVGASGTNFYLNDNLTNSSITTGPLSTVIGNLPTFSTINGSIQDSGTALSNLVTLTGTQTLSNKSLVDNTTKIISNTDPTKYLNFALGGNPGTFTTIVTGQTGSRFLLTPDITGTIIVDVGNQTLQNKSILNLAGTGTQDSFLNANIKRYYWTVVTTNNVATTAITLAGSIPNNSAVTLRTTAQAFCTAGPNINKVASRITNSSAKNVAGTYTVLGNTSVFSQNDLGLNGLTLAHSVSGSAILVQVSGLTGDTFTWTGEIELYF